MDSTATLHWETNMEPIEKSVCPWVSYWKGLQNGCLPPNAARWASAVQFLGSQLKCTADQEHARLPNLGFGPPVFSGQLACYPIVSQYAQHISQVVSSAHDLGGHGEDWSCGPSLARCFLGWDILRWEHQAISDYILASLSTAWVQIAVWHGFCQFFAWALQTWG